MEQIRKPKPPVTEGQAKRLQNEATARQAKEEEKRGVAAREAGEVVMNDLDLLLDEIDEVLEENAEEFVNSYVQRGGE